MCDRAQHVLPNDTGVVLLECKAAFDCLSKKEKLYAHYISQAAWNGGLAVLLQVSLSHDHILCISSVEELNLLSVFTSVGLNH